MHSIKMPIYQTSEIREFERLAQERFGISPQVLMQRAGKAAFDFMLRRFPSAQKIAVFCGSGNNGGDGYVLAQLAHERGLKVTVWQVGQQDKIKEEAKQAYLACQEAKVDIRVLDESNDLERVDIVVDAICGVGIHDNLRSDVVTVLEKIHRLQVPIFAIDVPTGINADTGQMLGAAVHATATITFIGLKLGLLTGNGVACTGEVIVNDLQLPSDLYDYVEPVAEKIQMNTFAHYLKPRLRDWHKGLSGHVLVVGGDVGYAGAARMAAAAALRVGAGLVSIATRPETANILTNYLEIMSHPVATIEQLTPLLAKANVVVLGPGLGQSDWAKLLWEPIANSELPLVVDADGLNLLAQTTKFNDNWVLTPHPGEAARLLHTTTASIQADRLSATKAINKRYGGVCVLKGAGSIVCAPNSLPALCDKGNPGMASAGMGDILSGVIGGLMSQGIPIGDAAKLGVYIHAAAGDLAAKDGERGMIATDLLPYLRRLVNYSSAV